MIAMVDAVPGLPGVVDAFPVYRGDPFARVFQFVDQDTTAWVVHAQVRRVPDSTILETFDVTTNFGDDPELVQIALDEDASAGLPARTLHWDLERRETAEGPLRTMLKGTLVVDRDVTRVDS